MEIRRKYNINELNEDDLYAISLKFDTRYNRLNINITNITELYLKHNLSIKTDVYNFTSLESGADFKYKSKKQITDLEYDIYGSMLKKIDEHNIKLKKDLEKLHLNITRTEESIKDFKKISLKNLDRIEKIKRINDE